VAGWALLWRLMVGANSAANVPGGAPGLSVPVDGWWEVAEPGVHGRERVQRQRLESQIRGVAGKRHRLLGYLERHAVPPRVAVCCGYHAQGFHLVVPVVSAPVEIESLGKVLHRPSMFAGFRIPPRASLSRLGGTCDAPGAGQ